MSAGAIAGNLAYANGRATNRKWLTWAPIVLADVIALIISGTSAVLLRHIWSTQFEPSEYLTFLPAVGLFLMMFAVSGLYPGIAMHPVQELRRTVTAVTAGYLILLAATFFLHVSAGYSRLIFLVAWMESIVLTVTFRNVLRGVLGKQAWWGVPVVILGAGAAAQRIARMLQKNSFLGLKVVAMLRDGEVEDRASLPAPVMGDLEMAPAMANVFGVRYAIVATHDAGPDEFTRVLSRYAQSFDHVLIVPEQLNMASLWVSAKDLGGVLGLELTQTLLRRGPQMRKRIADLLLSILGGITILPLLAAIYAAVRLSSRGPALYSQQRVGKDGLPFRAWKFRTMIQNADAVLKECLERDSALMQEWELNQKLRKDPRVTRIGALLRKSSLDELPQIWNIICGEMSLVGPRPIVENEIRRYGREFDLYRRVRPGITGLWQVSGRNHTTYEERIQFDSYYVRNWSVWLDIYILGRTVRTIIGREGAY